MQRLANRDGWVGGRRDGIKGCGMLVIKESVEIDLILPAARVATTRCQPSNCCAASAIVTGVQERR